MDEKAAEALSNSVAAVLAKHSAEWRKQLDGISKQLNAYVVAQASISKTAASLTRTYEAAFQSIFESIRPYRIAMQSLAESMQPLQEAARAISKIDLTWVREAWLAAMPPNWQEFSSDEIDRVLAVMEETGWCLAWCPRVDTIRAVLDADDADTRARVLLDAKAAVVEDLYSCLANVKHKQSQAYRRAAVLATRAFEGGHPEAAQALAAADISAIINGGLRLNFADAKLKWRRDPKEASINAFRRQAVLNMAAYSLQRYYAEGDDPVPTSFSRHATLHSTSSEQYTEVNSLAALLLATALIAEVNLLMEWVDEPDQLEGGS